MKHRTLAIEDLTWERLLEQAARTGAIFLSRKGKIRYVLMHADDGDQEVCALRNNPEFMAYLEECTERAIKGPKHSLEEVRSHFGLDKKPAVPGGRHPNGAAPRTPKHAKTAKRR
jgi:hypothetical protein